MMQHNVTVSKTIKALMDEKKYQSTKDILLTMNPADIAAVFEELAEEAGLAPDALSSELTLMELDGFVEARAGRVYALKA